MSTNTPQKQRRGFFSRFGLSAKKWESENTPAASEITQSDSIMYGAGTTTVASLMSSGSRKARTRQSIYDQWSMMEADPIVSSSVSLLVTAALGGHETSGELVFIEKSPGIIDNKQLSDLVDEIKADLSGIFNRIAFPTAYLGATFGDAYARIYSDGNGVIDVYNGELIRPPLVQPFERGSRTVGYAIYTGEKNFQRLDVKQMARMKMPRTQWVPQHGVFEKSLKFALEADDIDTLPLMPSMAGGSLIYSAEEPYNNLVSSLLGLVGQRWMDSIDEQMLTVNLSDMSTNHQEKFLDSVVAMLKRSKEVAEKAVTEGKPVMERIRHIVPVFNEKQLATVQSSNGGQPGRSGSIGIEDVMLHARLLAGAIGVDLSMIGFADQMAGGLGDGGWFRTSAQVAERARIIRVALADFYNQIIDIHTLQRYGVVFPPSMRPWNINFYGSISALESERQRTRSESMSVGLMLVQAIQQMKDLGATKPVLINFLTEIMTLDEKQAELYAEILTSSPPNGGVDEPV